MAGKKMNAKSFAQQKRTRRQWITFVRMCRYGVNSFSRNAWLSLAATAVMTITLVIVMISFSARNILIDTAGQIRDKVDMSIYIDTDTPDEAVQTIRYDLNNMESVRSVEYISPEEGRQQVVEDSKSDPEILESINEATNRNPGTFRIKLVDINDTSELEAFVANNETVKEHLSERYEPSFASSRRVAIDRIADAVGFAETAGIGATVLFVIISALIVFNTIRMAIYNRKEEIQMMKLIGAERSFIRGPFVVEAIMYGFIAAIFATGIGMGILYAVKDSLTQQEIIIEPTVQMMTFYIGIVVLCMIIIGAIIGIVSSLLATRRYLKI